MTGELMAGTILWESGLSLYIKIDNQDIAKITKQSLRKHIAAVPQDIVLLNKSLKFNISYFKS